MARKYDLISELYSRVSREVVWRCQKMAVEVAY